MFSFIQSQFRAKPPKVLKMNPFKPILEHIHSKPRRMTLHTEIRVTERREFQFKQILREERLAMEREQVSVLFSIHICLKSSIDITEECYWCLIYHI